MLNAGAMPGPSGWRNSMVSIVGDAPTGVQTLAEYAKMWSTGDVTCETQWLWTAAIIAPLDCGPQPSGKKKIRPIALAECLLKFAETCIIDECRDDVQRRFIPHQLGCGVPDGASIIIQIARGWAAAQKRATDEACRPDTDGEGERHEYLSG